MGKDITTKLVMDIGMVITVVSLAVGGGVVWGQVNKQIEETERRLENVEDDQKKQEEILIEQKSLGVRVEAIQKEQKLFREDVKGSLNRILRKLDNIQ